MANRIKEFGQKMGLNIIKNKSKMMGLNHINPVSVRLDQDYLKARGAFFRLTPV